MDEIENNSEQPENHQLSKKERRMLKRQHRQKEQLQVRRGRKIKKIIFVTLTIVILGGGIYGLSKIGSNTPKLPPTTSVNHSEVSPPSHIVQQPISDAIQRHMLEHSDGKGKPGIIIQYNCDGFECEPDLIEKLTELVKQYPENVYLGPNDYDGKIILTRNGKREILDDFNEEFIKSFIEN